MQMQDYILRDTYAFKLLQERRKYIKENPKQPRDPSIFTVESDTHFGSYIVSAQVDNTTLSNMT